MDDDRKTLIATALKNKGVNKPCPRCGTFNFEIVGQSILTLNNTANTFVLNGPGVPAAFIACSNCGFVTFHALGALNLMPNTVDGR